MKAIRRRIRALLEDVPTTEPVAVPASPSERPRPPTLDEGLSLMDSAVREGIAAHTSLNLRIVSSVVNSAGTSDLFKNSHVDATGRVRIFTSQRGNIGFKRDETVSLRMKYKLLDKKYVLDATVTRAGRHAVRTVHTSTFQALETLDAERGRKDAEWMVVEVEHALVMLEKYVADVEAGIKESFTSEPKVITVAGMTAAQQIAGFRRLIESATSYEGRVAAVAEYIFKNYDGQTIPSKSIDEFIVYVAENQGVSEVRVTKGNAKSEFVKDVKLKLKEMGFKAKRQADPDKPRAAKKPKADKADLARQVIDEIGNVFPDGDPHDALYTVGRKNGIDADALWDLIAKEFKKQTGFDSMMDYCAEIYDDYAADNGLSEKNPYKSS